MNKKDIIDDEYAHDRHSYNRNVFGKGNLLVVPPPFKCDNITDEDDDHGE